MLYIEENKKVELMNSLNIPSLLAPYFDTFYNPDVLDVMYILVNNRLSAEEISKKLGYEAFDKIDKLYKDAIINKTSEDNAVKYELSTLFTRVNLMATFQREVWENIPDEIRKKISEWHFGEFLDRKKKLDLSDISKNQNSIVPLNEAIDYLMSSDEDIYIIPCDCKSTSENCNHSKNTCITLGKSKAPSIERGYGRKISKEEAIVILNDADKEGLIHTIESHAICNCCTCCCYPMRASKELGLETVWPKVKYVVSIDEDKCVGCGLCSNKCQRNVFSLENRKVNMNYDSCVGCGVCVNACPKEALSLMPLGKS
ncbi:4Fe-4S dicluster domain-containing protein [Dethiosulfatibacter aminovorans DSM 17477]|uniref:4Fe-4S dicluster domain-containing protein n=1 Tax=Dethiosulfatibacter aminovorans DSM 17477 TaxID=1121476 RepID=A0A1M6IHJ2_9FIRM|nr:4Fe-4S binding protein [Dethiosulfatibacter aminovorans]SHJ33920.1 4Fe-4S dicluster domain-containing protein [Dethiosulfatibacter aminovorans DSM 17477]